MSVAAGTLAELRWERRLVFAFGGDGTTRQALEELIAARACELADRDVDVYLVGTGGVDAGSVIPLSGDARLLDEASAAAVRTLASGDGDDVELVLVGKDGGVKRRVTSIAALDELLVAIDGMPMRRAERSEDRCPTGSDD